MTKQYLTEKQVSVMTQSALSTLRNNRYMGAGIPYYKIGKSVRYSLEDVNNYMNRRKIFTSDSPGIEVVNK